MSSITRHPKYGIPVRFALADRTQIMGVVFVHQNQRVIEVLCDGRSFFPIETLDGVRLLNKRHVVQIDLLPIKEILEQLDIFPDIDVPYLTQNKW